MKQLILSCSLFLCAINYLSAQTINFQDISLDEAHTKAKKENKKVMMLVYFAWDGFARLMEQQYADASVASFYNKHFICIKKAIQNRDEALSSPFIKEHNIASSPTYLFFDPSDKSVIHKHQGRTAAASAFLAIGQNVAADFCTNFALLIKDYPNEFSTYKGEKTQDDLSGEKYISKLTLPKVIQMELKRSRNAEDKTLGNLLLVGRLSDKVSIEEGLKLLDSWAIEFTSCDLSFLKASSVQTLEDKDGGFSSKTYIPVGASDAYKDFALHLYLIPAIGDSENCRLFFKVGAI